MCYAFGLKENELNCASAQFVSLFLQGSIEKQNTLIRAGWEQARMIGAAFSKEIARHKFPWEKSSLSIKDIDPEIFKKFTLPDGYVN